MALMRVVLTASLSTLAPGAFETPFSVPAGAARWTITPGYMRATEVVHGVGCSTGSDGLVLRFGVRAELLFNGTQIQLFGTAAPVDTQILVNGQTLPLIGDILDTLDATACVLCAEWEGLDERTHNLTIIMPPTGRQFLVVTNATGTTATGIENAPLDPISSSISSTVYLTSSSARSYNTATPSPKMPGPDLNTGLLILGVVGLLALFLAGCFGWYYYIRVRTHAKKPNAPAIMRSRSLRGTDEKTFVLVYATDTVGGVKV